MSSSEEWESEEEEEEETGGEEEDEDYDIGEEGGKVEEAEEEEEEEVQSEEEDNEEADELENNLFANKLDVSALLERMGDQETGTDAPTALQPYEILAKTARRARATSVRGRGARAGPSREPEHGNSSEEEAALAQQRKGKKRRRGGAFGATVDDIWDEEEVAGELGLTAKGKKKARDRAKRRRKNIAKGKAVRQLPEEVTRKQGEANLLYATGKFELAIPLLQDVIKLAPALADPYKTLGLCHEQSGNSRRALDFYMITAHMTPKDISLWKRLATLSAEMGFIRQAIYCLSKVIVRDKDDQDARFDRALMYIEVGESKKALAAFEAMAVARPGDPQVPMMLARIYHNLQQPDKAIAALEAHVRGFPLKTEPDHVNILAELYMETGDHAKATELMRKYAELNAQEGLPIDLQVKLGICHVHLREMEEAAKCLAVLFQDPIEPDLCLDAADALLQCDQPKEALKLYERVSPHVEQGAALWSKMAECYTRVNNLEGAIYVYAQVVNDKRTPFDGRREAAMALAELLGNNGREHQAKAALMAVDKFGLSTIELVRRKAAVLLKLKDLEGYVQLMVPVVNASVARSNHQKKVARQRPKLDKQAERRRKIIARNASLKEQGAIFKGYVTKDRRKAHVVEADEKLAKLLADRGEQGEEEEAQDPQEGTDDAAEPLLGDLSKEDQDYDTVIEIARTLLDLNQPLQASEMLADCVTHLARRWNDRTNIEKKDRLRLLAAEAAMAAEEPALAMHHTRQPCATWPHSSYAWNLVCRATVASHSMIRQTQKSAALLAASTTDSLPLKLVNGHCYAYDGAYGNALGEFMSAYDMEPEQPLTLLCIGITHLNQAASRKTPDRDAAVVGATAFLQQYAKVRKNKQEAFYNMARAAHHLGLHLLAQRWYLEALQAPLPDPWQPADSEDQDSKAEKLQPADIDLRREIAYNLVLSYRKSGAVELARATMRTYLTI